MCIFNVGCVFNFSSKLHPKLHPSPRFCSHHPPRFTPDPVGGLSPPRIRIRIRFPWFCRAQNFMGQTVFWPNFGPITTDFDETRGDFLPPMRPRPWSGSRGRGGPKIEFLSWGGGGPMYAIVYPAHWPKTSARGPHMPWGPAPGPGARPGAG